MIEDEKISIHYHGFSSFFMFNLLIHQFDNKYTYNDLEAICGVDYTTSSQKDAFYKTMGFLSKSITNSRNDPISTISTYHVLRYRTVWWF